MSITSTQSVKLTVLNSGTLDIPFEYLVELADPDMIPFMAVAVPGVKGKALSGSMNLKPFNTVTAEISINPKKEHRVISGKVVLKTELGPGPAVAEYPFEFWTYEKQIALDDSKDVSVGRVMVGESATVDRTITNFGSEKVKYRIRIQPLEKVSDSQMSLTDEVELKGGKKKVPKVKRKEAGGNKKKSPWKDDSGITWTELSSMKLTGAAGTPKLVLSEEYVDFSVTGKGITKLHYVTLANEGNALLTYEFEKGWDFFGNICFEKEELMSGKISAGESVQVGITFTPDSVQEYVTAIHIKTRLDTKTIHIKGIGAIYKFFKDSIPPLVSFGSIFLGESSEKNFVVHNDCIYDITVEPKMFDEDPLLNADATLCTKFAFVSPESLSILGNSNDKPKDIAARMSGEISAKFEVFPQSTAVAPQSAKEFRIDLKAMNVEEGGELASILPCRDVLKVTSQIPMFVPLEVDLSATLIDGVAKPRAQIRVPIHFIPKIGTSYSASCTLETDERSFVITLVGSGQEPSIALNTEKIDFGIVGVGAAEYQHFSIVNNSKIPVKLGLHLSGRVEIYSVDEISQGEIMLAANEEHIVKVVCNPQEASEQAKARIEIVNLDIPPNQKKAPLLGSLALESIGGKFEFNFIPDPDVDPEEVLAAAQEESAAEPVLDSKGVEIAKTPTIFVNFSKVIVGQRVRKYFEVENCGDTMIDLIVTDVNGREAKEETEMMSERTAFTLSPVTVVIKPRMKQKFAVIAKGMQAGEDVHYIHVRTRTQLEARIIPIRIKVNILSPESQLADGLKVFARVDNSIDGLLQIKGPSETTMNSDLDLWKIYIPVIRVSLELPSQELKFVPAIE
ncbi:hypothetical protein HDU98_010132, partial [Podochytrium sp. JEL0797]